MTTMPRTLTTLPRCHLPALAGSVAMAWRAMAMAAALFGALLSAGCATNPATGEGMFTIMSMEEEKQVGAREHPRLVEAFGGAVDDPMLIRYVDSVGQLLARTSELPDLRFSFTILDTDTVNAFALPGGYVYLTRGLLALANSEAEMAGVLAHEIGHITARHSAQRYSRAVLADFGTQIIGVLTGRPELGQLAGTGAALHLQGYSREQEFEADMLGIRYLKRAGFEASAMASFLASLRDHSRLQARLAGLPESAVDEFDIMATHPRTLERVEQALRLAGETTPANPIIGRDIYLDRINGMLFGDSPEQGYVRGRAFLHPVMRFRFEVPEGFRLANAPDQVTARHENGAMIVLDQAGQAGNREPLDYLLNVWARGRSLGEPERFTVNGLAAATGSLRLNTREGTRDLRLVAIRVDRDLMLRFLFITPPETTQPLARALRETLFSFHRVSPEEASRWQPLRIRVVRVAPGDTVQSLAARMAVEEEHEAWFRVLNGLGPGEGVAEGARVKLVTVGGV